MKKYFIIFILLILHFSPAKAVAKPLFTFSEKAGIYQEPGRSCEKGSSKKDTITITQNINYIRNYNAYLLVQEKYRSFACLDGYYDDMDLKLVDPEKKKQVWQLTSQGSEYEVLDNFILIKNHPCCDCSNYIDFVSIKEGKIVANSMFDCGNNNLGTVFDSLNSVIYFQNCTDIKDGSIKKACEAGKVNKIMVYYKDGNEKKIPLFIQNYKDDDFENNIIVVEGDKEYPAQQYFTNFANKSFEGIHIRIALQSNEEKHFINIGFSGNDLDLKNASTSKDISIIDVN